jgi:dTDP-4-amino-4,6-dideoxygalactose transaminase
MNADRQIPFFNYPSLFARDEREYMDIILDVLRRGAYIMQRDLAEFEKALSRYLGVKYAIGTADGTMALTISLMASGLQPDDEVIVPSHTFVASAAAVKHAGGTPVLADCGHDHLIDPASIEKLITAKTCAIMPVQLNGRTADMDAIMEIAQKRGLSIIEDSCQALGSKFKGTFAGTFGIAGAFSFYPSKTLGCFGDGGALVTNDDSVAEKALLLRDHGRGLDGEIWCFGFNARLDNLQAAILNFKLQHYDNDIARRRELAARYHTGLKDIFALKLPPPPNADEEHFDIYQNYEIEAENRDELRVFLQQHGVSTILQWGGHTIHQFEKLGLRGDVAYTDEMTKRFMLLPMNTSLSDEDVDYICQCIRIFYQGK